MDWIGNFLCCAKCNVFARSKVFSSFYFGAQATTCRGALTLIAWERKAIVGHEGRNLFDAFYFSYIFLVVCASSARKGEKKHKKLFICSYVCGEPYVAPEFYFFVASASHTEPEQLCKEFLLITWQIVKHCARRSGWMLAWAWDMLKNDRLNDWSENDERWIFRDKEFYAQFPKTLFSGRFSSSASATKTAAIVIDGRWFLTIAIN